MLHFPHGLVIISALKTVQPQPQILREQNSRDTQWSSITRNRAGFLITGLYADSLFKEKSKLLKIFLVNEYL